MMCATNRPVSQARATPVRGRRTITPPRWRRTPIAALLLTFVAVFAPEVLLAPIIANERPAPSPLAQLAEPPLADAPFHVLPLDYEDRRVGAGFLAPPVLRPPTGLATPDAEPVPEAAWNRALEAARAEGKAHGVSFAAVRGGELVWAGTAGRTREGGALETSAPMVIGSVTKTFVAAAVLQLVEEGRIGLDDPARRYLPDVAPDDDAITVRRLLDHTSGLADLFNDETRRGLEEAPERPWTADAILGSLHAPWYEPGEGWAYANTNYYLLGMLVERVTGASLVEVLDERFIDPLGLDGTRVLTGADGELLEPAWASIFWASGAMAAPAADLARWGDALYGDGILEPGTRRAMLRFNRHDHGLGAQRIEVGATRGIGHTGLLNTYTTILFHVPGDDVTIALLVNRSHVDLAAMLRARPTGGPSLLELALDGGVR